MINTLLSVSFTLVLGIITLAVSLVALTVTIISFFKTKKDINQRIKEIENNKKQGE